MLYDILLGEDTIQKIHNFIKNKSISIITMETITTKKGQKSFKSKPWIGKIIFSSLILLAVITASGCIDLDEKEPPEENCDSKHLSLCDDKDDCENAGGYWYNNQCNEEEEMSGYGDLIVGDSDKEFIENLETFDLDNDGSDDKYVYKYERIEVAENLFLDKSYEFNNVDSGLSGEIILRFENTGDNATEYTHIEVIPKSFAESVDDLEFSVQPDEIIEADPVVKYYIKNILTQIKIKIYDRQIIFNWGNMDVNTFSKLSCEEQYKWINDQIGPYKGTISETAKKHNIPPRLLATVILTELGDYDDADQWQEIIPNTGSVGMAQISVNTAIKHGLVDVSEEEIQDYINHYAPTTGPPNKLFPDYYESASPEVKENIRMHARQRITWQRLNQPEIAIEAAAREIEFILSNVNDNLDNTWAKSLLTGPIDRRGDLYKNLKPCNNLHDPYLVSIEKEGALATLVIGPYNSGTDVLSTKFNLPNPCEGPVKSCDPKKTPKKEMEPFCNGRMQAFNGRTLFSDILAQNHMFEEGEYTAVDDICCGQMKCCPNNKCHVTDNDKWLMCKDGKCVNCGGKGMQCCPNNKCGSPLLGETNLLMCKDGVCVITNSGKEFTCPSPPKEAKHIVTNTADYWKMPDGKIVGQYQTWWDSATAYPPHKGDKTRRLWLGCYNTEGKWQGVWKRWDRYGYQDRECNFNDGYGICKPVVHGTVSRLGSICYKDGKQVECCREEGLEVGYSWDNRIKTVNG
jgi:hypothetical protein